MSETFFICYNLTMNNKSLHEYFERSYRTGTDIWTHIPTDRDLLKVVLQFAKPKSIVLDIGCGRGLLAMQIATLGLQVLGVDIHKDLIAKNNEEVKHRDLVGKCGFMFGSGLSIPFTDQSFDVVVDSGFMHHLYDFELPTYKKEILRCVKHSGIIVSLTFSHNTTMLLGNKPVSGETEFEKYGLHYKFYSKKDLEDFFHPEFSELYHFEEVHNSRTDPGESLTYHVTVWQKN